MLYTVGLTSIEKDYTMAKPVIYGIKNCNTMKKTFDWFDDNGLEYEFYDYKKQPVDTAVIKRAIKEYGWDKVINTRGMTWRKVDEDTKQAMNDDNAVHLAVEKSSVIKRPLIVAGDDVLLGFDDASLRERFV